MYLSTRLFGVGRMTGVRTRTELLDAYLAALLEVLGPGGTVVVPTFTQQVGRFGVPYVHEETTSLTGIFGEYLRKRPDSLRSLHPVFSVTAVGRLKEAVCADVSPVAFGADSAFDRLVTLGGKAVCLGFEYYSGHIVSLMHHVETMFGVPYYYNKIVSAPVSRAGAPVDRVFVINVKYLGLDCEFDYRRYIDTLARRGRLRQARVGDGEVYAVALRDMVADGVSLLKDDVHAFLDHPPRYTAGTIPCDGPEFGERQAPGAATNWEGYFIGL